MAIHHRPSLLLLVFLTALLSAASQPTAPSPPQPQPPSQSQQQDPTMLLRRRSPRRRRLPPPPVTSPPPPAEEATEEQMNNIIDALIGSGDFGNWADLISGAVLPLSATLFVPENDAVPSSSSAAAGDPYTVAYHVVPQRLTFPELLLFKIGARLPTLLPGKSVVVTNNSRLNFTIDGSPITLPDLYSSSAFTIHGVAAVFDYAAYGGGEQLDAKPKPRPEESQVEESLPAWIPATGEFPGQSSDAAPPCLCAEFPVVLLAVCGVLGLKIQRIGFGSKP